MISIINPSGRTRTDRTDRTDPDGPGRTRTDPDGRTDGRTVGRAGGRTGQTGPIGICTKFKTGGVTSNLSEIHTVDDLLCSSDPNLLGSDEHKEVVDAQIHCVCANVSPHTECIEVSVAWAWTGATPG